MISCALRASTPQGTFFLGDIRNNRLLRHFHASVKLFQAPDAQSTRELAQQVLKSLKYEKEFLVDPEMFL